MDVMISIGPSFFYTVTLPCTLWFLDKGKKDDSRADTVLFIDARDTYRQLDRAHRDFTPEQCEFLANIVRLYRGEEPETGTGRRSSSPPLPTRYRDVPPLQGCDPGRIEAQGGAQPRPHGGVAERPGDGVDPRAAAGAERDWRG